MKLRLFLLSAFCFLLCRAYAFPPAPNHTIYGLVRDQYGVPLSVGNAQIIFEPTNGVQITTTIVPELEPGVNYRLSLPMDSGTATDLYKTTALRPFVSFRIRVKVGTTTYLPMEMTGNYATLGKPAQSTRIDLTLGVDANNDGLPDAWQDLLRLILGPDALLGPNDDADGDGISNLNEYLAGTYAFDPESGFRLSIFTGPTGTPMLEFMAVSPRTYTVYNSTNLQDWTPIRFNIPGDGPTGTNLPNYQGNDIRTLQIEPILPDGPPAANQFFKVQVQ